MSNLMASQTLDSGQLDLFVHSRAVILTNDTINALLAREAAQASACLGRLGAEVPDYGALNALENLSRALSEWPVLRKYSDRNYSLAPCRPTTRSPVPRQANIRDAPRRESRGM
jgi:hypothetical protein